MGNGKLLLLTTESSIDFLLQVDLDLYLMDPVFSKS